MNRVFAKGLVRGRRLCQLRKIRFEYLSLANCVVIKPAQSFTIAARLIHENDRGYLDLLLHAIESKHGAKEHPCRIASIAQSASIIREHGFEPTRSIVSEISNSSPGKRGQPRTTRQLFAGEIFAHETDCIDVARFALTIALHNRFIAGSAGNPPGIRATARIAGQALATFDRFEQESMRRVIRDSQEST